MTNAIYCLTSDTLIPAASIKYVTFGATQTESDPKSQCDVFMPYTDNVFVDNFKPNYPNTNELPSNCPASNFHAIVKVARTIAETMDRIMKMIMTWMGRNSTIRKRVVETTCQFELKK